MFQTPKAMLFIATAIYVYLCELVLIAKKHQEFLYDLDLAPPPSNSEKWRFI